MPQKKKLLSDKQIEDMGLRMFVIQQHVKDIVEMSKNDVPVNCFLYRDIRALARKTKLLTKCLELVAAGRNWPEDRLMKVFSKRIDV